MKRLLLIALLALPGQLFGQTVLNFPRIISGSDLVTSFRVVNPTNQEASITLTAFEASGAPLIRTGVSNPYTAAIPAGGSYAHLFSEVYGTGSFNGWVQVTSAASGLTGFALNSNQANTDVDGAIAVEPASEFILPFVAADLVTRTEVTLVNVNNDPAQVTLTLYGVDGTALGTKSLSLASKALLRQHLQLFFPGIDQSAASHVKVRSDRLLASVEVVADFQVPAATLRREIVALPGQRSLSDLVYVVPHFVTGTPWASYLQVVNGSGVSQEVTLTAYGQDGIPFSGGTNSRREVIPGNGAMRVSVQDYFGLPANQVSTGWIEIRGSVGYLNVAHGHGNTLSSSFAMTAAIPAGEAFRTSVHNYFVETPTFSSALYVANNGSDSGSADVYVLRADGSTAGHSTLTLGSKQQVSRFLRDLVPASRDLSTAWVIVRSSVPVVSVLYVSSANGAGLANVARQPLASDFTPPNQTTASISGIVAQDGVGVEAATVRLTGPVVATKTTDSSGRYVFAQLPAGDYTVSVSKPPVQFFPAERSVTLARENLDAVNFPAVGVVSPPVPSISLLSPSSAFGASSALSISVFGSGFNQASKVHIDTLELQTSFVSNTELKAVVPVDLLKLNSALGVTVVTPPLPLGGGTSNRLEFTVNEIPANPLIEGRIAVGKFPAGVAIDEGLSMVVVSNESDDNVSLINLKTLERLGAAAAGRSPAEGIGIHERTGRAFVGNAGGDNVSVIDLNTRTEKTKIKVGRLPVGVAVSESTDRVFVANGDGNSVTVIDANNLTVVTTIENVGSKPAGIAVSPAGNTVVVTNRGNNTVSIIDLNSLTVVGTVAVEKSPRGVAIDPVTNFALVVNAGSNNVSLVDIGKRAVVGTVGVGTAPTGIAVHAGSHSAVVTNSGVTSTSPNSGSATTVSIINLDELSVLEVQVEAAAFGVAIDQQGQRAFVANFRSNVLSVIRIPNPTPRVGTVEPKTFPVGGGAFTITVRGTGFLPTSVVTLNGKPLATKYISPTELQAQVTPELLDELLKLSAIQTGGDKGTVTPAITLDFKIEVSNPGPGGGVSPPPKNPEAAKIEPFNALPLLTSITPTSAETGKDVVITFSGNNFAPTSLINFGGNSHSPTTVTPTQMTLRTPAVELHAGDVPVSVTNVPPGGGTSAILQFRVFDKPNPVPSVSSVTPSDVAAGTGAVDVALSGSGFIAATSVSLGGVVIPANVTPNTIQFRVDADSLRNAASLPGLVTNPLPGGGTASFSLSVLNPVPSLTDVSPTVVDSGSSNVELQIRGARFVESSSVLVAGTPLATRFVNQADIRATLSAGFLKTPGNLSINVSNPAPGGGVSDSRTLTVRDSVQTLTITPAGPLTFSALGLKQTLVAAVTSGGLAVPTVFQWTSSSSGVVTISDEGMLTTVGNGTATIVAKAGALSGSVSVTVAQTVSSVEVTPNSATLTALGQTTQFSAVAKDSNGSAVIGETIIWTSASPAVATVSANGLVTAVGNGTATIVAKAGDLSGSASVTVGQTVGSVEVSPKNATLTSFGETTQLSAVVKDSKGNPVIGGTITWTSTLPSVATVNSNGLVTAVGNGTATIVAKAGDLSGSASLTVGQTVGAVEVSPNSATLTALGQTAQFSAVARDPNGSAVIGETITWTSMSPSVATVNSNGLVTANGNGSATIVAKARDLSGSASVTVAQTVSSVEVSPLSTTLTALGQTTQLSAVVKDSRGSVVIGETITWTSTSPSVATVNSSGLVTATGNGSASIVAKAKDMSGSALVTVGQTVGSVEVLPKNATLTAFGETTQVSAVVKDSNGSVVIGETITWTSTSPSVATVNSNGLVTAVGNGTATIIAKAKDLTGSASVTVGQTVSSVEVSPLSATLTSLGETTQFSAIAKDSKGFAVVGETITWTSTSPSVATVNSNGLVTAVGNGTATIVAKAKDLTGSASVTVAQTVSSIEVSPLSATLTAIGETIQLSAVVKDSKGSAVIGETITWTSTSPSVATVNSSGLVTAVGNGTATIVAKAKDLTASASVTVAQTVSSVEVSPLSATLTAIGATKQFSAVAKDSKGAVVLGATIAWTSSSPSVATVNSASGLATAVADGSTDIRATAAGKTGTAQLTVAEILVPPVINPPSAPLPGLIPSAMAAESDDFLLTINGANFTSGALVTLNGTGLTPKTATSSAITVDVPTSLILSPGVLGLTVTAHGGISNAVSFTVGNPIVDVTVAPSSSITFAALGLTQTFAATAKTTGGTVVPKVFQWTSSNTSVATVSDAGLVTAVGNGTASIVATADGLSASVAVTVGQVVNSVEVSPSSSTLAAIGATAQFSVVVKDSNAQSIAGKTIAWSSDAPGTAGIDSSGLATAAANGATMLRASVDGKQGTVALNVSQAVATVEVSPSAAQLGSLNVPQTFTAVAKDANGVVITGKAFAWTSSTGGIATLSAVSGVTSTMATSVGNGNTSIEASVDGKTGSSSLTVSQVADSVQVSTDPDGASTTLTSFGATLQLRALVKDANNQTINGKTVAWESESPAIAGVSSTGQVTALDNGSAAIRATVEDRTATLSVTVGQIADSLSVSPSSATLSAYGSKQRFTGTLRDANGNPMQGALTWSSSSPSVATIASLDAVSADATAVATGTTTISASVAGKIATATLTVSPVAATIELSPETRTLDAISDTFTFTPTIKDELGNTITGQPVVWESSSPSVATVHSSTGLVTAVSDGSTTIKATVGGKTATAQLIVAQAVDSIAVGTGSGAELSARTGAIRNGVYMQIFAISSAPTMTSLGDERVFTAVAKDRKGNTIPGKNINWTSSNPDLVTVDSTGKATAVGNGTATIVASVEGKTGSVNQVVDQVVDSVSVSPNSATLTALDETVPLTAVVKDARGHVIEGKPVTWSSSSAAAMVSSGLVTAISEGTGISINASIGAKTGSAAVVVHQEVSTIEVTPDRRHFNLHGLKQIFAAVAKDARGHAIGGRSRSWSSSRSDLAEVNTSGEVTSKGNGSAVISVTIDGKTAVSTVTVAQNAARIEIDQSSLLFEGLKESKSLVAHFFNELGVEVLKGITWTSSKLDVATISAAGVLTAEGNGVTTITATADGISASISVRVNQKLDRIVVTQLGSGKLRALGRKRQFFAKAVDRNGFEIPGKGPKWRSSNDGIAGINENGEATGKFNGLVTITAEIDGVIQTITLEIDQLAHHIEHVSGSGKLRAFNRSRQLRVLDEDGNPIVGKLVFWTSSDGDIALVDSSGVAKSHRKNGKAKIRAAVDGILVETDLDVDQDVASIEVSADGNGRIPALNRKRKHTAIARDPDGNLVVGKSVEWLTSDGVTGPIDVDGFVTAKKNGKVQIFARIGGLTSLPVDFEVFQTTISVTVTGESSGKIPALNRKRKHTAVARDPDGNIIEGRGATWTSSRGDLALVNSSGEVTAKGNGTSRIKVVIDGVEGSLDIEVDQQLSAVLSSDTGKIKALNRKRQYRAVDPDGSDIVGKTIAWSTSDASTALMSGSGVFQGKKNGKARITATIGIQVAFTDMEILQEVAIVTVSTIETGKITAFKHKRRSMATARDADGYEITGRTVTWISSNTTILIVNSLGDAESQRNGSGKISASVDGVVSNALTFEVSQVIAVVTPAAGQATGKFKSKNETRQFVAKDANGNAIEKTTQWRVGDSAVADVDGTGRVTSRRNKKTAVSATVDGVTVSSDLDVEQEAVKVVIEEGKGQLRANNSNKTLTLEATGYDDKGEAVEEKTIQWSIDKPFIATVSSNGTVTAGKGVSGKIRVTAKMDDATTTIELDVR